MIDVKKQMTFDEVRNFFSETDEFTVEDLSNEQNPAPYLRITLRDYYSKKEVSTLMSTRIAIQHLIRTATQLKGLLEEANMNAETVSVRFAKEERTQLEMKIGDAIFNYNQITGGEVAAISVRYIWSTPNSYNVPYIDVEVKI